MISILKKVFTFVQDSLLEEVQLKDQKLTILEKVMRGYLEQIGLYRSRGSNMLMWIHGKEVEKPLT